MQWIISDVHGCFFTLQKLINRIKNVDPEAQFVFIGDYFDRGLFSKECVEYILQMQADGAVCLRGNHDNVIDFIANGECEGYIGDLCPPSMVVHWWRRNGFNEVLTNYGVTSHLAIAGPYGQTPLQGEIQEEFIDKFPESHKQFVRNLQLYWENETHFACHAYLPPDVDHIVDRNFNPQLNANEILWERFPRSWKDGTLSINPPPVWSKIGVFGHTPVGYYGATTPINQYPNLRLIDTCVFADEYMCGYCCSSPDNWILQATDPRDIGKD